MTQQEIIEYNKMCAEFLGGENHPYLIPYKPEPDDMWFSDDGKYPILQNPNGSSMWKLHELKFHSDWNWIMEVILAINMLPNPKNPSDTTLQTRRTSVQSILRSANKEAVVQAINRFLIYYNNEHRS
jgi:hypothetical protein